MTAIKYQQKAMRVVCAQIVYVSGMIRARVSTERAKMQIAHSRTLRGFPLLLKTRCSKLCLIKRWVIEIREAFIYFASKLNLPHCSQSAARLFIVFIKRAS
jgi:hypothetical protein